MGKYLLIAGVLLNSALLIINRFAKISLTGLGFLFC